MTEQQKQISRMATRRYYARNRERILAKQRERGWGPNRRVTQPERMRANDRRYYQKHRAKIRAKQYLRRYGVDFDALVAEQRGRCLICGGLFGARLVVDHDHVTGKVRGLLCQLCNKAIGLFKEDAARLAAASKYLLRHQHGAE